MIGKFAAVPGFRIVRAMMVVVTILAGAKLVRAQQAADQQQPAAQQPAAQQPAAEQPAQQPAAQQQPENQPSSQETSPEESSSRRKVKPHDYKNWSFNIGGGASMTNGKTKTFVRGGGGVAAAGVARNYNKYFGLRADFQFDNLPLRNTALEQAQAPGATSHMYSLMLGPVINIPATKVWGGYLVFGPSFDHRSGRLDSSGALPGAPCNPFFTWWGRCYVASLPVNGDFLSESLNQFGFYFGGGITRKIRSNVELYGEFRDMHGTQNGITTDLRPITIGVRW
jgi:hypothetical protein